MVRKGLDSRKAREVYYILKLWLCFLARSIVSLLLRGMVVLLVLGNACEFGERITSLGERVVPSSPVTGTKM